MIVSHGLSRGSFGNTGPFGLPGTPIYSDGTDPALGVLAKATVKLYAGSVLVSASTTGSVIKKAVTFSLQSEERDYVSEACVRAIGMESGIPRGALMRGYAVTANATTGRGCCLAGFTPGAVALRIGLVESSGQTTARKLSPSRSDRPLWDRFRVAAVQVTDNLHDLEDG